MKDLHCVKTPLRYYCLLTSNIWYKTKCYQNQTEYANTFFLWNCLLLETAFRLLGFRFNVTLRRVFLHRPTQASINTLRLPPHADNSQRSLVNIYTKGCVCYEQLIAGFTQQSTGAVLCWEIRLLALVPSGEIVECQIVFRPSSMQLPWQLKQQSTHSGETWCGGYGWKMSVYKSGSV